MKKDTMAERNRTIRSEKIDTLKAKLQAESKHPQLSPTEHFYRSLRGPERQVLFNMRCFSLK